MHAGKTWNLHDELEFCKMRRSIQQLFVVCCIPLIVSERVLRVGSRWIGCIDRSDVNLMS